MQYTKIDENNYEVGGGRIKIKRITEPTDTNGLWEVSGTKRQSHLVGFEPSFDEALMLAESYLEDNP